MAGMGYTDDSLAEVIDDEIQTFLEHFNTSFLTTVPLLMFPMELGKIATKCIRYHAAIYNLVAFYAEMSGKLFIVLCQHRNLKPHYQQIYSENCHCSQEDSEVIHPYRLYNSIQVNIASLASRWKRRTFGLDSCYFADQNGTDNATASSHSISTSYPAIFIPKINKCESSEMDKTKSEMFLHVVKNYLAALPAYQPYPLLKDLPVTQPLQKCQPDNLNCMGDSLITNPTDDTSSAENKLNGLPFETNSVSTSEETIGENDNQYFKFKYFMDQVLECESNVPLFVQARNNYEPYKYVAEENLNSVLELYNIPTHYKTIDLLNDYNFGPRFIKWCDSTHALLIYTETDHANMGLMLQHHSIRARPMIEASPLATIVACMMDFPTVIRHLRNKQRKYYYSV